jgi:chromosomal replication initiator protein
VQTSIWNQCIQALEADLSEQQINTWIRPLQAVEQPAGLRLLAPNRFIVDWVNANCMDRISDLVTNSKVSKLVTRRPR